MNNENIGTWAGLVWNALNDAKKALTLKDLRKASKLKVNEMHCALGWLAKEGKLNFKEGKDDIEVWLREAESEQDQPLGLRNKHPLIWH